MKYEGMHRELYYIITRQSTKERVELFYNWYLKNKGEEEE